MRHKRLQKSGILCLSLLLGITMLMTGCEEGGMTKCRMQRTTALLTLHRMQKTSIGSLHFGDCGIGGWFFRCPV